MPSSSRAMNRLTFVESSSSSSSGCGREGHEPAAAVLCAPRPRRVQVHPCSADLILGVPPFLLNNNNNKSKEGGKSTEAEGDEAGGWALFGGSPPARADNPLVHDPHFLLNQQQQRSPLELGIFDHQGRSGGYSHHRPTTYISSSSNSSSSSSFAPSFAPAVRIQGFDVAACRSSHSNGGGRVLSARA
ncbi:hypothetical protein BS78_03G391500 [Paspalum vaginatum]|nr:hypothetical protein BS78_03G391500 [Paspalum vaginatum]